MAGINQFSFKELEGSSAGQLGPDGAVRRSYLIAWTDLGGFYKALRGRGWVLIGATNGGYDFDAPEPDPDWIGYYCRDVEYEGWGACDKAGSGQIIYPQAKVTATFRPVAFNPADEKDIIEEELDAGWELLTLPPNMVESSSTGGPVPVTEPVRKVLPTINYTITLKDMPQLPGGDVTLIMSLLGKVNSTTFRGAAVKKMLFMGARARRTTTNLGEKNWQIELKFWYRDVEWTKVFVNANGDAEEVTFISNGKPLYDSDDLTQLLPTRLQ